MKKSELLDNYITAYFKTIKYFTTLISEPVQEFGLSFDQYLILHDISQSEEITPIVLADKYKVTKGAISRQLKGLMAKEYINQVKDARDGRRYLLEITEKGQEIEMISTKRVVKRFDKWVEILGEEDVATFLELTQKIDQKIMRADDRHLLQGDDE